MKSASFYLCLAVVLLLLGSCSTAPEPVESTESIESTEEPSNPFVGTWILNIDKSTFDPQESALKSDVVVIEAQENGLKFTFDRVDAEGNAVQFESAAKFDGKPYPVGGEGSTEMVTLERINENSFKQVVMRNGEVVEIVQVTISVDGKSSTVTAKTTDEKDQEFTSYAYYDKQ